jgi:hypothetical protein
MARKLRIFFAIPTALGLAFACHTEPAPGVPRSETKAPNRAEKQSSAEMGSAGSHGARSGAKTGAARSAAKADSDKAQLPLTKANTGDRKAASAAAKNAAEDKPDASDEAAAKNACPTDMQLVEGEYCGKVDQDCEKSWYDESNKKTVCEKFAPKARCIGNQTKKRFCIDRFEWPNKKGERPEVMNKFHQAEVKCAAVGKRLCTESEWTMACEGPSLMPFPYGYVRDTEICHGDVLWDGPNMSKVADRDPHELARLWKGVRSGSQPGCVSDYGIYDMTGNADEVVASETFSSDFRGKFDSVHTGGPWYKGVRNQCRPKIYTHDEGFYYYFLSFRCCGEPDGAETDPRTPKQKKAKWDFQRVERIAGFSRADVKAMLEKKLKLGHCACRAKDQRCNTICGTLLGPEAKDVPKQSKPKPKKPSAGAVQPESTSEDSKSGHAAGSER